MPRVSSRAEKARYLLSALQWGHRMGWEMKGDEGRDGKLWKDTGRDREEGEEHNLQLRR